MAYQSEQACSDLVRHSRPGKFRMHSLFLANNARALAILTALGPQTLTLKQAEMSNLQNALYQRIKPAFVNLGWNPDGPAYTTD